MKNAGITLKSSSPSSSITAGDRTLWLAIFALLAAGLVMIYSSSFIFAQERFKDGLYFFKRHLVFMGAGVGTFILGWRLPVERLRQYTFLLLISAALILVGALIPGIAHRAGGASRWITIFGFTFQPAELAKLAVLIFVATQISRKIDFQENFRTGFLTYFIPVIPLYVLLLCQPDFGTVALLLCTAFCMLLACGVRIKYLVTTIAIMVPTATSLILTSAYRRARVLSFVDPWSDPAHKGFERALAVGISVCVGLQAFFNMGVVLGLLPTKGLPLPLISYGGTSLVVTLFMLGVLAQLSETKA
ncbi:MAG: FtsW/RodA/SpoVE family cell cycle protein [Deltaproteobacteria bacterium]|nr:FtsW/RodA/SpoVE family cell cycle protein [Deltaproteobacteria bacterium]